MLDGAISAVVITDWYISLDENSTVIYSNWTMLIGKQGENTITRLLFSLMHTANQDYTVVINART